MLVRRRRAAVGLTQQELAARAGVSVGAVRVLAQAAARAGQNTIPFQADYARRSGAEAPLARLKLTIADRTRDRCLADACPEGSGGEL